VCVCVCMEGCPFCATCCSDQQHCQLADSNV